VRRVRAAADELEEQVRRLGLERDVADELGYLPPPPKAPPRCSFQVIAQRYGKTSTIVTTNRPITGEPGVMSERGSPVPPGPTHGARTGRKTRS
jgi:DNA replication protein DnaC